MPVPNIAVLNPYRKSTYASSPLVGLASAGVAVNANASNAGQVAVDSRLLREYISLDDLRTWLRGRPPGQQVLSDGNFRSLSSPFSGSQQLRNDFHWSLLWPLVASKVATKKVDRYIILAISCNLDLF